MIMDKKLVASYFDSKNTSPDNVVKHYAKQNNLAYNGKHYDYSLGQWAHEVGNDNLVTAFQISDTASIILWDVYKLVEG